MPESRRNDLRHWEAYYRGGALACCPLGPGAEYTQELRQVWEEFFTKLPDGARVLDVGTGNGAIALIAAQAGAAAARRFEVHATDLAQIDPVRDVRDGVRLFSGIRFHPQVATEELPFESGSFDAVSGQYALEYTDPGRSLPEIRRVLRPGARAQFVLHHADSVLVRNARESLAQSALVLEQTKVLRLLRRFLETAQRAPATARRARARLADAVQTLQRAAAQAANTLTLSVTIDAVQKVLGARPNADPAALGREVERFEGELRAAARRLDDLVRSGQTAAAMESLAALARSAGLEVRHLQPQHHGGGNLVGWRLLVERRAGDAP